VTLRELQRPFVTALIFTRNEGVPGSSPGVGFPSNFLHRTTSQADRSRGEPGECPPSVDLGYTSFTRHCGWRCATTFVALRSSAVDAGGPLLGRLSARWLRSHSTGESDRRRVALVRRALQVEIARSAAEASARAEAEVAGDVGAVGAQPVSDRPRSGAQSATLWTVWCRRRRGAVYGGYWQGHNR